MKGLETSSLPAAAAQDLEGTSSSRLFVVVQLLCLPTHDAHPLAMDTVDAHFLDNSKALPTFAALPATSRELLLTNHDWATDDIEALCGAVLAVQAEYAKLPSGDEAYWLRRNYNMWKDIDDRISRLLHLNKIGLPRQASQPYSKGNKQRSLGVRNGDDSDVDDDEFDLLFPELNDTLADFGIIHTRSFLVVRPLNARQRRHFHAIAHFCHFGHMSVGSGPLRMLLLSKRPADLPSSLKKVYKSAGVLQAPVAEGGLENVDDDASVSKTTAVSEPSLNTDIPDRSVFDIDWDNPWDAGEFLAVPPVNEYPASGYQSVDSYSSLGSECSAFSDWSAADSHAGSTRSRKRRREPGAFLCPDPGCFEIFDRQCDLSQHQRSHVPYEQRPYPCADCNKRFLFPKD